MKSRSISLKLKLGLKLVGYNVDEVLLIWAHMHDAVLVYAETSGYVGTSKSKTS